MNKQKVYSAIGLMSGTALDGEIDVALIRTDGHDFVEALEFNPFPYDLSVREKVRACFGKRSLDEAVREAESLVTDLHIQAVKALDCPADVIGFHGQTITHEPDLAFTWQIGDGALLARESGIDVVCDFRSADIKAGGQGAPLVPLYHKAIMANVQKPVAVLNLGGVANITFLGENGEIEAFDTGPANALMDDLMRQRLGKPFDDSGALARSGQADSMVIRAFLDHSHFQKNGPKSLDRNAWNLDCVSYLSNADAMATLCEMTVQGIRAGLENSTLPRPEFLYVCGGGRHNTFLLERLSFVLDMPVVMIEQAGWNGDAIEAQGFAYLAVRSLLNLPLSLPSTTGVKKPITGGIFHRANLP